MNYTSITRRLTQWNFSRVRKGERVFHGVLPCTVVSRPIHGKWILLQEDPEVREVCPTRFEILQDIEQKRTGRTPRKVEFEEIGKKPFRVYLRTLRIRNPEEKRKEALHEFRHSRKGVRETYWDIRDPKPATKEKEALVLRRKNKAWDRLMRKRQKVKKLNLNVA